MTTVTPTRSSKRLAAKSVSPAIQTNMPTLCCSLQYSMPIALYRMKEPPGDWEAVAALLGYVLESRGHHDHSKDIPKCKGQGLPKDFTHLTQRDPADDPRFPVAVNPLAKHVLQAYVAGYRSKDDRLLAAVTRIEEEDEKRENELHRRAIEAMEKQARAILAFEKKAREPQAMEK
eukprot:GFYU01003002.1.p2 GENE.GFYU01003002.1~~GFYU01003002.1.p2  ORF type:complete len:175 (-),score=20.59 GFYU01003002.1:189-713(-)